MQTYKLETRIDEQGQLHLAKLPFHPGDEVEVTVIKRPAVRRAQNPYSLRGLPYRYDRPTDPVADEDWDVLK